MRLRLRLDMGEPRLTARKGIGAYGSHHHDTLSKDDHQTVVYLLRWASPTEDAVQVYELSSTVREEL